MPKVKRVIAADATIEDVLHTLSKPESYVCGVLANLFKCKSNHGDPVVRIGVTGQGIVPYYRIDYAGSKNSELGTIVSDAFIYEAFNEQSHTMFLNIALHDENWSTSSATFSQVQTLIGKIRGRTGKSTAHRT